MSELEFQDIIGQLVAVYERDVGFLRQELSQRSQAAPRAAIELGPQFGTPSRPDKLLDEHGLEPDFPEELDLPKPRKSAVDVKNSVKDVVVELERMDAEEVYSFPKTKRSRSRIGSLRLRDVEKTYWENLILDPLEHISGAVICLNVIFTLMQLEIRGGQLQASLGKGSAPDVGDGRSGFVFLVLEHVFNAFFLSELILRISILRWKFFRAASSGAIQWFNVFDFAIVLFCSLELYLSTFVSESQNTFNLMFARLLRLARLSRTLKVIQVMRAFSKLRILLKTVAASMLSFTWSMMILAVLNVGSAIFLCQMLQPTIADETVDLDLRFELFRMYGTSARAVWTMFEFTFSGGWPAYARPVIENVHWTYSLFFATYVSVVVFAVIRIITALFLKETLNVAAKDADFMVQESIKAKREYAQKLKELFELADSSGNGTIDIVEFNSICEIPQVLHYFQILELEIAEVHALFDLLDDGDGQVTFEEFVKGIIRLKGTARSMDVLSMMKDCERINDRCQRLEDLLTTSSIARSQAGRA